jgi:sugar diacid utilization regulator
MVRGSAVIVVVQKKYARRVAWRRRRRRQLVLVLVLVSDLLSRLGAGIKCHRLWDMVGRRVAIIAFIAWQAGKLLG